LASAAFLASDNKRLGTSTQKVAIAFGETKDINFVSRLTKGFDTAVYDFASSALATPKFQNGGVIPV
jgi:hypothetical protein